MPSSRQTYNLHLAGSQYGQANIMSMDNPQVLPVLTFTIQPENSYRFRHSSELKDGSHGCIKGQQKESSPSSGTSKIKIFPTVQLTNYNGLEPVRFEACLFTHDHKFVHAHKLMEGCNTEIVRYIIDPPNTTCTVSLSKLIIEHSGKPNIDILLKQGRYPKAQHNKIKNTVVIRVQAFRHHSNSFLGEVCSEPITHSKNSPSQLNINYISRVSGQFKGEEEGVILCKRLDPNMIDKNDPNKSKVYLKFFEDVNGKTVWEKRADLYKFHYQDAIIFKTPKYTRSTNADATVKVLVQLCHPNENYNSETRDFEYLPDENAYLRRKRQKILAHTEFLPRDELTPPSNASVSHEQEMVEENERLSGDLLGNASVSQDEDVVEGNERLSGYCEDLVKYLCSKDVPPAFRSLESDEQLTSNPGMVDQPLQGQQNFINALINPQYNPMISGRFEQPDNPEEDSDPSSVFHFDSPDMQTDSGGAKKSPNRKEPKVDSRSMPKVKLEANGKESPLQDEKQEFVDDFKNVHPDKLLAYKLALHTAQCLHNFAKTGNVTNLLMSMRHLVALQDAGGDNAIHAAVVHSQQDAMQHLIEAARTVKYYDILNMCNELKQSPLHIAVQTEQVNAVKLLLYHGGNPNLKDRRGNTPIHLAAQLKSIDCLSALLDINVYTTKYKNNAPDLDSMNYAGFTPLHLAVLKDSLEAVQKLCYAGCDVDVRDRTSGRTALHIAVERHNQKIIRFLLQQANAEADMPMFNGNTPLHLACAQDHADTVSLLMEAMADPYLESYEIAENNEDEDSDSSVYLEEDDVRGLTPLDLATSDKVRSLLRGEPAPLTSLPDRPAYEEPVQEMIQAKADPDKGDNKNPILDSGIVMSELSISSNSGLSVRSPSDSDGPHSLAETLDDKTKERLGKELNSGKWREVVDFLNLKDLERHLEQQDNPTSSMLHYLYALNELEHVLGALQLTDAVRVLNSSKP